MLQILQLHVYALVIGFLLDLCFGDPEWMPHLIRLIGKTISLLQNRIRKIMPKSQRGELTGGSLLVIGMLLIFGGSTTVILYVLYKIHPNWYLAAASFISYQMLAMKDLKKESMLVYTALEQKDIEAARSAVARIVGRDTKVLDETGIIKAAIETVAENTSDGEIAPIFYMAVGGPVLGILYKTINTMDSMVGYKNQEYLYFGRTAAKLDDIVNFIPARVAAICMILASGILHLSVKDAIRIFLRDRYCHASPNSAQTEAVMAGALQVQLAGDAYYFGTLYPKKTIGDAVRTIRYQDIKVANRLLYMTGFIMMVFVVIVGSMLFY